MNLLHIFLNKLLKKASKPNEKQNKVENEKKKITNMHLTNKEKPQKLLTSFHIFFFITSALCR